MTSYSVFNKLIWRSKSMISFLESLDYKFHVMRILRYFIIWLLHRNTTISFTFSSSHPLSVLLIFIYLLYYFQLVFIYIKSPWWFQQFHSRNNFETNGKYISFPTVILFCFSWCVIDKLSVQDFPGFHRRISGSISLRIWQCWKDCPL